VPVVYCYSGGAFVRVSEYYSAGSTAGG
jgi:hypothetical protein